jgi:hypothetical protein
MGDVISCVTVSFVQIGAVISAGLAAVFWIRAAMVRIPAGLLGGDPGPISDALRRQSRMNAFAAGFAAAAAVLQCVLVYSPNCIKLT